MRFLHLGDLHIGKHVMDFPMIEDQRYILGQILEIARERSVDMLLLAGDIYDRAIPSEEAVALFDEFIRKAVGQGLKICVISGNHDSEERLSFGSSLFEESGLYICGKYDGNLRCHTFRDAYGPLSVYLLPYVKTSLVRHFFPEEEIDSCDEAVGCILQHAAIDKGQRNILLAHQFVAGKAQEIRLAGSENMAILNVGTVDQIGWDHFEDFDYTALGHIHSPQRVGKDTIRYAGSPLKYSVREAGDKKSVPLVELKEKGNVTVELIPLVPRHELRHIRGTLQQLAENVTDPEDYIFASLTDEEPVINALGILRAEYPNLIHMEIEEQKSEREGEEDQGKLPENLTFHEILQEFYQDMYGQEIPEGEEKIMERLAKEAGILL